MAGEPWEPSRRLERACLTTPEALHEQNQGRLLGLRGEAYVGLGNLPRAIAETRQAVDIFAQLAQQDPSNTEWQRDLSEGASAQRALLEQGLAILYRLREASRLSQQQEGWIATFEQALQAPPLARGVRRLLTRLRACWGSSRRESA